MFELINAVYTYHQGEFPYWVYVGGVITAASPGTITAVVFLFDPSLKQAWMKISEDLIKEYGSISPQNDYTCAPPFSPISPGFIPTQHLLAPTVSTELYATTTKITTRQYLVRWAVRRWLLPNGE
ncbi:hypothetical protein K7432_012437 [Basidiobolus ranarum]|uniref:Uncharacterized protein n=1 Tax=Basidiobolus ranarum TaxID=34480 RepID=A0ABR2WKV3_9FUNG